MVGEEKEEEERSRKRLGTEFEYDATDNISFKKPRTPARNENAEDDDQEQQDVLAAWLTLNDETVMELSELLDLSEAPFDFKVKFIHDPYVSPEIFQSSSAYVTINGNEESCGSSFSDSESSVMASVDMGSFRGVIRKLNADGGGAWGSEAREETRGWVEENDHLEGIFVKSLSGRCCDLFGTPPPHSGNNYENESVNGDGDGDDEMWVNFLGEDFFGGAW